MLLTIKNIGLIDNASIRLDGLTVIGGENDMGKSTAGKLMFAITKVMSGYKDDFDLSRANAINELSEKIYIDIRKYLPKSLQREKFTPISISNLFLNYLKDNNKDKIVRSIDSLIRHISNSRELPNNIKFSGEQKLLKIKEEIHKEEKINELIRQSLHRAFTSEFYFELSPNDEPSTITITDNDILLINIEISNNEITKVDIEDSIFNFNDVTFIETPIVLQMSELINYANTLTELISEDKNVRLDNLDRPTVPLHIKDLMNKMEKATDYSKIKNETNQEFHTNISKIISGDFEYSKSQRNFIFNKKNGKTLEIKSLNTASGIKSFGIIQLLLQAGFIDERTLLIIDEPETHLHPKWQIEYAKLLIELVKNDFNILLTSHSPYIIQALRMLSEKEDVYERTAFYLAEKNSKNRVEFEDVSRDIKILFKKLAEPLNQILWQ